MRLEKIRLRNLNSLYGEWEIDLTHPAYRADGLFIITGPTGSGKTTILDAVCLALFGRTPRIGSISKSGNEIMSRQTADCFSEVTFVTESGSYRATWSQELARRKPGGKLQDVRRQLAESPGGAILEEKASRVGPRVESLTGLDFSRFTRSMLLAQGGFAAFLEARPDERATILEQITGTDIYALISRRAHERRNLELSELNRLKASLGDVGLLGEAEEEELGRQLAATAQAEERHRERLAFLDKALAWLGAMDSLAAELREIRSQAAELEARAAAFRPQEERLLRARRALELAGAEAALEELGRAQEKDMSALRRTQEEKLPGLENLSEKARAEALGWEAARADSEARREGAAPAIKAARLLDAQAREARAEEKAARESALKAKETLERLGQAFRGNQESLETLKSQVRENLEGLARRAAEAQLSGRLEAMLASHESLAALAKEKEERQEKAGRALKAALEGRAKADRQAALLAKAEEELSLASKKLAALEEAIRDLGQGRETGFWRERLEKLAFWKEAAQAGAEADKGLLTAAAEKEARLLRLSEIDRGKAQAQAEMARLEKEMPLAEKGLANLEEELDGLRRAESLSEMRAHLEDGKPCPLCGSLEHPLFADKDPQSLAAKLREEMEKLKGSIREGQKALSKAKESLARLEKEGEILAEEMERRQKEGAEMEAKAAWARETLRAHGQVPMEECLAEMAQAFQRDISGVQKKMADIEGREKEAARARSEQEKARARLALLKEEAQALGFEASRLAGERSRLEEEALELGRRLATALGKLEDEIALYGLKAEGSLEGVGKALELLGQRRDSYQAALEAKAALERRQAALEAEARSLSGEMEKSRAESLERGQALEGAQARLSGILARRSALFGEKDPDLEEAALGLECQKARDGLESWREKLARAETELAGARAEAQGLEAAVRERARKLSPLEASFGEGLSRLGFESPEDYRAARLGEEEREELERQREELQRERMGLLARESEKARLLEEERARNVTQEPASALSLRREEETAGQKEAQRQAGAISQKLSDNQNLKKEAAAKAEKAAAQERIWQRFEDLAGLIGSHDGRKYRQYVQALTFDMLMSQANLQLRKITGRYLLYHDRANLLSSGIIDGYQAGERRSTRTLSGGESFLVSLALALGLSRMASQKVRVDSLFLDEGFGTLDEEALDTALETLASLPREGKMIGIISHVPSLGERIGTQIRLEPLPGGRSALSGPGCRRIG